MKWSFLAKPEGVPRYLVCNADESEPGTFKDHYLMWKSPHTLIEGMIVSSFALGTNTSYIYVRGELMYVIQILEKAIQEAYDKGFLGKNILGTGYDLDLFVQPGGGAYICGEETALLELVNRLIAVGLDGIIFEDYNKGVLTPYIISSVIALANNNGIVTTVDPKKDNFFEYKNVTLFKPNLKELKEGLGVDFSFVKEPKKFESAIDELEAQLNNQISFVTLSEHGVFIKKEDKKHYAQAHIRNIADVSGAGDTVISIATLCLVIGLEAGLIAEISNIAGGLVCEKSGVVSISKKQLLEETIKLLK